MKTEPLIESNNASLRIHVAMNAKHHHECSKQIILVRPPYSAQEFPSLGGGNTGDKWCIPYHSVFRT